MSSFVLFHQKHLERKYRESLRKKKKGRKKKKRKKEKKRKKKRIGKKIEFSSLKFLISSTILRFLLSGSKKNEKEEEEGDGF